MHEYNKTELEMCNPNAQSQALFEDPLQNE